jgi:hypothetical protein
LNNYFPHFYLFSALKTGKPTDKPVKSVFGLTFSKFEFWLFSINVFGFPSFWQNQCRPIFEPKSVFQTLVGIAVAWTSVGAVRPCSTSKCGKPSSSNDFAENRASSTFNVFFIPARCGNELFVGRT